MEDNLIHVEFERFFNKLRKGKSCGCSVRNDLYKAFVAGINSGWACCIDSDYRIAIEKALNSDVIEGK